MAFEASAFLVYSNTSRAQGRVDGDATKHMAGSRTTGIVKRHSAITTGA